MELVVFNCLCQDFLYISDSEDAQVLLNFHELRSIDLKLVVHDSKNDALKILKIQNINCRMDPQD